MASKTLIERIFGFGAGKYGREVPVKTLLKGTAIIILAPAMLIFILAFYSEISIQTAFFAAIFIFIISVIFVRPYIANLSELTNYVRELSLDRKASAPDLSFLNNVEELSEAVKQLHESWEKRKRQLEETISEGKIIIDILPDILLMLDENLNIVRTNSTAKSAFGGRYFRETLDKIISDTAINQMARDVLRTRHGRSMEFFLPAPFSRNYVVLAERFPANVPGSIALIIVMHDITKQKQTETMLSDFVANASHEIRTPLTSVLGFIETLQTSAKDDEKSREEFLEIMHSQAERMSKLVNDLLSLSQIERNIHTKPTEKVGIKSVLKEVCTQLQITADNSGIKINTKIKGRLPKITADRGQIAQVFDNLISNAIKYGKPKSEINIFVQVQENDFSEELSMREFDRLVTVSIEDQGDGIEKDHIPRLTERFYRVDKARSRKIGGSGLGLAIVKHILDRHHGILKIKSEVGKGSVFTVYLPV